RPGGVLANCKPHRIRTAGDLAYLDGLDIRQAEDALELQLELVLIQIPQAFAEAVGIAAADFIEPRLDHADLALIFEIELERSERERHRRAEQQHACQQPQADAASRPAEDPRQARQAGAENRRRYRGQLVLGGDRRHRAVAAKIVL